MQIEFIKQRAIIMNNYMELKSFARDLEIFGRVCYKSEDKITEDSCYRFIKMIIKNGHESVLEHKTITVKFIVDRALANALVRHRHCAFSQESTHFINYGKKKKLTFIVLEDDSKSPGDLEDIRRSVNSIYSYIGREYFEKIINTDAKLLRHVLPLGLKTELVMTTNLREWRHILKIRSSHHAHPQMRNIMTALLKTFKEVVPEFFEDIE